LPTVHRERLELSGRGVRNVFGTEGFSRTVLEAMASARPVIASRVSGVPEQVVDRETGVLVEPSNAGSLAQALIEMLDVGRAQRASMGEAAFHRVGERFSVRAMADDTLGVYREIGRVR